MKKDLVVFVILVVVLIIIAYLFASRVPPVLTTTETATTTGGNSLPETVPTMPVEPYEITLTAKANKPANGFGVTLAPIEVVEDSRCPVDENIRCIQAGTVRVRTKITNVNGERILIFTIGTPITSKTETTELMEVLPPARAEVPILANEYRFVFKIIKSQ
ncbi:MAG: hypothetical protein HZB09_01470 [Candidatus Yonathbacteria bacterium]|nr:hypothetical protein [Candidatus Yonathbacteria bacterium]